MEPKHISDLRCVSVIEKDINSEVLWTWSFPTIAAELQSILWNKCCLKSGENTSETMIPFLYGQYNRYWYYLLTSSVKNKGSLPKVTEFTIVLLTKDFNPERHQRLCSLFAQSYNNTGSPTSILQLYLDIATKGSCSVSENNTLDINDYPPKKAFLSASLKDVINTFGIETILIYTGVLLKKKIVFYSPHVQTLLNITRAIPQLVWHRQNWDILHPLVDSNDENDLRVLKSNSYYVAGFTDASVENQTELYDIFANVSDGEVSVSPQAKETFQMGKVHKDIAMFMVNLSKNEDKSNEEFVMELSEKTEGLINNLKSLAVENEDGTQLVVKLETLKERKLTSAMENFLYNLAAVEGLV